MAKRPVRLILVSCVGCGRLHAPKRALDLHPRCESCRHEGRETSSPTPGD